MKKYKVILERWLESREELFQSRCGWNPTGILTLLKYENPVSGKWVGKYFFGCYVARCTIFPTFLFLSRMGKRLLG